ncbi:MAG: AraC family transcriptional regulator [Oscillospiraceae bacterium]|jgi:AraC-like DNA-binding protein|nr:AraC family transcriptional regulator [Oscillospiraceae bacterium]
MEKDTYKFSYKSANQDSFALSVYNTGYQRCEPGYSWGMATRDHYLLHFVTEGKGYLTTPTGSFDIPAGGMFLIRPGELCGYVADRRVPWEYYWVGFNGAEAHRMMEHTPFAAGERVIFPAAPDHIRQSLKQIYDARGNSPAAEARMLGGLYLFLAALMEEPGAPKLHRQTTARQYVDKAILFISRNYILDISNEDIASFVGVSPSHLYRVFSLELGVSPTRFLTNYRLSEAAALLQSTGMSVSEVAASVGFKDPLYFSRVFRKVKGVSPSAYQGEKNPGTEESSC